MPMLNFALALHMTPNYIAMIAGDNLGVNGHHPTHIFPGKNLVDAR